MVILSRENMNRKYTKETISILKENYPKHGYKKCKEITGLSKKIIQCLAQRHSIYKLPNDRRGGVFSRLKNGVILQRELHQLFHKLYGREINDPKQFEEFRLKYKQGLTVTS